MTIRYAEAYDLALSLLLDAGFSRQRATTITEAILLADVWGLPSHGLLRLPYYLDRCAAGGYRADAELATATDTGPLVTLDGGGGLGHWQVAAATELARERCLRYGIAAVAVADSGHCGALGAYTLPLVDAGLAGLVFSNGPAVMAPWGSNTRLLSTSPIAAGIPIPERPAIVDLALSAVARGTIAAKAQAGEPLPEGWALDADGEPTTDAQTALHGLLAPLGGAKGFALAFLVESLTGGMIGPNLSADVPDFFDPECNHRPQGIAHLVVALDPRRTAPGGPGDVEARLRDLAKRVAGSGGRVPGGRRLLPAEITAGTPLTVSETVLADLRARTPGR